MSRLKRILSKVLNIPEESIGDETSPAKVESWDSFNALLIVSELESSYSISFTMEEVTGVKCVADIKRQLIRHGIHESEI
ncbi:MAG: acyl carrier protein [Candidatus Omnitrophica bacterium]|nr:acyl carrier protein [Candidatus Omnitrophota bacterium]